MIGFDEQFWLEGHCLIEECPHCGSNQLLSDYFEEDWFFWCGHCGKELMEEQQMEENRLHDEERNDNTEAEEHESKRDEAEGFPTSLEIPSVGGSEV